MLLYVFLYFLALFDVFHHKVCVVIIFISFFDKVSNFHNRILTNQKQELVIRNCQWNYMLWKCESMKRACVRNPLVTCVLVCLLLLVAEIIKYFKTVLFHNRIATNVSILEKPIVVLNWQIVWRTPVEIWCFKVQDNGSHVF